MRRDKNDQSLLEVLKDWLAQQPAKDKYDQSRIQAVWQTKMGVSIGHQTEYVRFRNGTVSVKIRSSALKQELHMGKTKILELLQESCPDAQIREVIIL